MGKAPIVLFVYRRPAHTSRVLRALLNSPLALQSPLIVYSDAPRTPEHEADVAMVRALVRQVGGFASVDIRERSRNLGLSRSLTSGISDVLGVYDRAIVIEDDIVVSPYFLQFMNDALDMYQADPRVASIHGYVYPATRRLDETFFMRGADCWGWATWGRAWSHFKSDSTWLLKELTRSRLKRRFDLDGAFPFSRMLQAQAEGRVDSWAIRWHASTFLDNMYTLYPGRSLVQNVGHDGSGEHSGSGDAYYVPLTQTPIDLRRIPVAESMLARQQFASFLRTQRPSVASRLRRRLAQLVLSRKSARMWQPPT